MKGAENKLFSKNR